MAHHELNPPQQEAVEHIEGALLVLAGAGSGKTRVVTQRIVHLIELGVPPSRILGVTFTNKAAGEMRERVARLTKSHVNISTFHSLGARILRESIGHLGYKHNFTIYDSEDSDKLLKSCLKDLDSNDKKTELKNISDWISSCKNDLQGPSDVPRSALPRFNQELYIKSYQLYQAKLRECQAVDFDDLIYLPVKLFKEHPAVLQQYQNRWDFLLIDEYQDTNAAQYTLAKLLAQKHQNIFVVGDPDQSIYGWRGADIENILHFEEDYPGAKVVRLEQNYRSTNNILEAANAVIKHNTQRYEKKLWSDKGQGERIKLYRADNDRDEANFVASRIESHKENLHYSEMVVFYRTHALSRSLEDMFLARRIPYVIVGGVSFYQRREIKDILAYLRIVLSDADFVSFSRTINLPKRGIGDATIEKLRTTASSLGIGIVELCRELLAGEIKTEIKLSSKQKEGLKNYIGIISELRQLMDSQVELKDIMLAAIQTTEYLKILSLDAETFVERKENLDSLVSKAAEWEIEHGKPDLRQFLEELTLKSSLDESAGSTDCVSLMTIHNGKGLEYPVAFIVGMEEGLFPHINSSDSKSEVEEERRLCYVGMTRAKEQLYLTHARQRMLWGTTRYQKQSRFLLEIPPKYLEILRRQSRWDEEEMDEDETEEDNDGSYLVDSASLDIGDIVMHSEFGRGMIKAVLELDIGMAYRIFFEKTRLEKTVVAKYARLIKVG